MDPERQWGSRTPRATAARTNPSRATCGSRVANVSGGVRVYRKNPITGTRHEWRITKRGSKWKAYKTLP
jgi:hypothetical protein